MCCCTCTVLRRELVRLFATTDRNGLQVGLGLGLELRLGVRFTVVVHSGSLQSVAVNSRTP